MRICANPYSLYLKPPTLAQLKREKARKAAELIRKVEQAEKSAANSTLRFGDVT